MSSTQKRKKKTKLHQTGFEFPAWCVVCLFGPTFYNRDVRLPCRVSRPPAYALTIGGCWEQLRHGAASHLYVSCRSQSMHHGQSGVCMGSFGSPCFLLSTPQGHVPRGDFFIHTSVFCEISWEFLYYLQFNVGLPLETARQMGYNTVVYRQFSMIVRCKQFGQNERK